MKSNTVVAMNVDNNERRKEQYEDTYANIRPLMVRGKGGYTKSHYWQRQCSSFDLFYR